MHTTQLPHSLTIEIANNKLDYFTI